MELLRCAKTCLAALYLFPFAGQAPDPSPVSPGEALAREAAAPATGTARRALPELDREPSLRVFLARARRITIQLAAGTQLEVSGRSLPIAAGPLTVEAIGSAWRLASAAEGWSTTGVLASGGRPLFTLDAIPLFGKPRALRCAGDLLVRADAGEVEVVERVPMEAYLASVVGAEMNPKWPAAALAAQAIVARSYAAARWMERCDEPWQLHWHFGVDMAYHGWSTGAAAVAAAIAPTRGEVLMFRGFPVLALFHASSGGRTEAFERIKPGVLAPDGRTSIAAAMPIVDDDAALLGAMGLALDASHGLWKADIPLPEVTQALVSWSEAQGGRTRFGEVLGVSVAERHPDSRRVATVSVRHRLGGVERTTTLAATDFRMAVSPVRIRSLWWERCVIASKPPGYLVLEGRGFGHGCGLSQVSAWYLAQQGATPEAIVSRFYAGAKIERRY
jgi:peptidoglycan hydrolase-like amidase